LVRKNDENQIKKYIRKSIFPVKLNLFTSSIRKNRVSC